MKIAAYLIVGSIAIPIVVGAIGSVITFAVNGINKVQYKKKIEKGLKEGTIVEIDGEFYEVSTVEED